MPKVKLGSLPTVFTAANGHIKLFHLALFALPQEKELWGRMARAPRPRPTPGLSPPPPRSIKEGGGGGGEEEHCDWIIR